MNFMSDAMRKHEERLTPETVRGPSWSGPALLLDRGGDSKVFILCHILNCTEEFYGFREFDGYKINNGR